MCKTNMKWIFIMITYANMTRLWCKIMLKINVEQTKGNDGSYFYVYTPLGT